MSTAPENNFDQLLKQLGQLPMWVKQVLYAYLRKDLEGTLAKSTLDNYSPDHMLQLWAPELSREGVNQLSIPTTLLDAEMADLLRLISQKKNVVQITAQNHWSLAQSSELILKALDSQLVQMPTSTVIMGTLEYMAGRSRLGEYLLKTGRLTQDQLWQALQAQASIESALGEKTGIANVLINLGYLRKEATDAILFLKDESRKPLDWKPAAK